MNIVRLADMYWMGLVGGMSVASVVMATTLRVVLISPMMGLSTGGMALVSRYIGQRDQARADRATMQVLLLIALFAIPIMIIGHILTPALLRLMGASPEVHQGATQYLRIIWWGLFFMECLPTMSTVIKGAGKPEYTLRVNIVNLAVMAVVEPVLVLGLGPFPAMGIRGAALAAVLGSAAGVTGVMVVLLTGAAGLRLHLRDVRPDWPMMGRILRISFPASIERLSPNLGAAVFMRLVAAFGDQVLTAYSVFSHLFLFLQAFTLGGGHAASTMVGQNLGAGKPERSTHAAHMAGFGAAGASALVYGLLAIAPGPVLSLFGCDPASIAVASQAVRVTLGGAIIRGWGQVLGRSLAGAGDALSPMVASVGALWLVQLPASWILSGALGPLGIWLGMVLGDTAHAIAMTWRFRQGRWKLVRV